VFYNVVLSFYCCFNFLFCIIFFIFTIKIYFNYVCNYLYQLCTNRRRYFIWLRGTNTTPALLCPQPRKCFVTVQLLHVFDVDDCDLAVVNVNYEQVCQCYFVYVFCLIPPPPTHSATQCTQKIKQKNGIITRQSASRKMFAHSSRHVSLPCELFSCD